MSGRGSYSRDSLSYLKGMQSSKLEQIDQFRIDLDRPSVSEMDASARFRSKWHIAGENASILTAGIAMADFDHSKEYDIVGITGNSMGFYTALGISDLTTFRMLLINRNDGTISRKQCHWGTNSIPWLMRNGKGYGKRTDC